MIEVSEAKTETEFIRVDELYDELLRYYGRVIRVKTITVRQPRTSSYQPRATSQGKVELRETVGRLNGLELVKTVPLNNPEATSSKLSYRIDSDPTQPYSLDLKDEVQILQEDSGSWKLIHRHSDWGQVAGAMLTVEAAADSHRRTESTW